MTDPEKQKDLLRTQSREMTVLQDLVNENVKGLESSLKNRSRFRRKWDGIARLENFQGLKQIVHSYSESMVQIEEAQNRSIEHIRTIVLDGLRGFPERLKERQKQLKTFSKEKPPGDSQEEANYWIEQMKNHDRVHIEDMKLTLLHYLNAQLHYHSVALDTLAELTKEITSIDPEVELETLKKTKPT
mmetsp:Transcript_32339/g.55977  ORF Transcript_32339/g.55977 Transcript_32339/m.55977 type:complete len:187 (-) Transcript_32339:50-610(-)